MLTDEQATSNGQSFIEAAPYIPLCQPSVLNSPIASPDPIPETIPASEEPLATDADTDVILTPDPPFEDIFKRLGGLRDGLLVSGGVVYLLGRLVWAFQSQCFNQGIVSVDQSQYFVAGFVPAVILALVWSAVQGVKSFLQILGKLYVPNASRRRRIFQKTLAACYIAAIVICGFLWAGNYLWTHRYFFPPISLLYTFSLVIFSCIVMAGLPLLARLHGNQVTEKMQFDHSDWLILAIYPVIVGVISIIFYGGLIYPQLSQEFGGALPRVAYLDLDRAKLSPDTLKELIPPSAMQAKSPTVRTVLLDVFFAGKDTLLVKPYRKWPDNRTYEVPGSSVLGRTWADPAKFRP